MPVYSLSRHANAAPITDNMPVFRRLALVASDEVQASGLGDLLTTELSGVAGLQLVERDDSPHALLRPRLSLD
jgi:hypothetical protein